MTNAELERLLVSATVNGKPGPMVKYGGRKWRLSGMLRDKYETQWFLVRDRGREVARVMGDAIERVGSGGSGA